MDAHDRPNRLSGTVSLVCGKCCISDALPISSDRPFSLLYPVPMCCRWLLTAHLMLMHFGACDEAENIYEITPEHPPDSMDHSITDSLRSDNVLMVLLSRIGC